MKWLQNASTHVYLYTNEERSHSWDLALRIYIHMCVCVAGRGLDTWGVA